jgi:predicted CoA-binding protein
MTSTKEKLLGLEIPETRQSSHKVSIIGVGQVGMACAYSIMNHVSQNGFKAYSISTMFN